VQTETTAWRQSIAYRGAETGFAEPPAYRDTGRRQTAAERSEPAAGGYYPGWIADLIKTVVGDKTIGDKFSGEKLSDEPGAPPIDQRVEGTEPRQPPRRRHFITRLFGRAADR
jgi:hypothetical protein